MVKERVLVTGGSGYLGARICLYLSENGYRVTPVCFPEIPDDKYWLSKMENVVSGDIRDEKFLEKLSDSYFDIIIHLVSLDHHQSGGNPTFVSSINVTPVWSLLHIFSKKGLKRFIFFSTVQVYGQLDAYEVLEQQKPLPINPYGLTHLLGEQICEYYNRTTTVCCNVVRLSNSYGAPVFSENNCWWLVINDLCHQAYHNQVIVLQSDGTPLRDFIHGWDVCQAVLKILDAETADFIFQVSSGKTLTILEIAQCVQSVYTKRYNKDIQIERRETTPKANSSRYRISNDLLKDIGFNPSWSLEQGINDLFNFLEVHDKR